MTDVSAPDNRTPNDRGPERTPAAEPQDLPAAARRALAEAEARRRAADTASPPAREIGGRGGNDPVRYGDWEIKGRAIDF